MTLVMVIIAKKYVTMKFFNNSLNKQQTKDNWYDNFLELAIKMRIENIVAEMHVYV